MKSTPSKVKPLTLNKEIRKEKQASHLISKKPRKTHGEIEREMPNVTQLLENDQAGTIHLF